MSGTNPQDYWLQRGEIVDVSNPKEVLFKTKDLAGNVADVKLDWATQAYPNKLLGRVAKDTQGMLKPLASSPPQKGVGALYIAAELCNNLEKGKFPSELAARPGFYRHEFTAWSLILDCVNTNGSRKQIDLLMPSRADLTQGITWEGDKLVVWISAEGYRDIAQNVPTATEPPTSPAATGASGQVATPSANPQLVQLALDYCATLPDSQLRAALVPLLKVLAGPG